MVAAANVDATAVNTIAWLSEDSTTIVVPVYQRQYRWDIGGCEQLLQDIRAVSDADDAHTHFIASILSTRSTGEDDSELVLIDGQQRITTLTLLVAALHHTIRDVDPVLAARLATVLVRADDPQRTKLRPHRAWADVFESVALDRGTDREEVRESRFYDNYAFFRSQVGVEEVPRIWRGLQKLEHVAIALGADANAQQIFESLNSTGAPLRDHELIHNYVLMGLSHAQQRSVEDEFWLPIEQNTGEAIGAFWRHYLVMRTGLEGALAGPRGVYDTFRQEFPRLDAMSLRAHAAEWLEFSAVYRVLLDPTLAPDAELGRQLGYLTTFGRQMHPLVMGAYREWMRGETTRAELLELLELVQSLLLRRLIVGLGNDRLVARLIRARAEGADSLRRAFSRIMPSDERVKVGLKFTPLPHPSYVLGRLARAADPSVEPAEFLVDHIVPQNPGSAWSGDGERAWADYSDDEQNSHRALAPTLGNLALVEVDLFDRVFDKSFPAKRGGYADSAVAATSALAGLERWSTAGISARTVELTAAFLAVWTRPAVGEIDDDNLTPILDAERRTGWVLGWQKEFSYTEYVGEHWEVHDVRYLFNRIFKRLWADQRAAVEAYVARRGGPIYPERAWNGQWDEIDEGHQLYMGWDARYMMAAVQGVLEEAGLARDVFVKYREGWFA